jgi:hypothetical protein
MGRKVAPERSGAIPSRRLKNRLVAGFNTGVGKVRRILKGLRDVVTGTL